MYMDTKNKELLDRLLVGSYESYELMKGSALDYVSRRVTEISHVAEMLSLYHKYNDGFPKWARTVMDSLSLRERAILAEFVGRTVYGRLAGYRQVNSETKGEAEVGNYKYIAYSNRLFISMLDKLPRSKKFIDVGCGIGMKPFIAWLVYGHATYGVELNPHTYEMGRYFLDGFLGDGQEYHNPKDRERAYITLMHNDAFDMTYENYDIVYMYRPIQGDRLCDLYEHVYSTMAGGAVLIEADAFGYQEFFRASLPGSRVKYPLPGSSACFIYKEGR